ncbi:metallopeptidase family protein [Novosphingobium tardum]|uniref:Metallopeptidase family protein n=1 Tax=Novosphingobium tardum TaxID=1538021 RepID=A0ABV8RT85_9SPHN
MELPAPSAEKIMQLAQSAIARLPRQFRDHLADVALRVDDFADDETLDALDIDSAWDLTGLYHGRPLTEQSIWASGDLPPVISLFRRPLLSEWAETGVDLEALIYHVIVHEVGHHFGFSDEQMHSIEDDDT